MIYSLYRIGHFLTRIVPLKASYAIACLASDIHFSMAKSERRAVIANLKVVGGEGRSGKEYAHMARDVFRNFAKYLVDFFRFEKIDEDYMERNIKITGRENIDKALSRGKGVIMLSAHIGNWELGGFVVGRLGYPISAVVLAHQHKKINDFFTRQRQIGNMRPIELGMSLRACYNVLKSNQLLALLGDRDFLKNGLRIDFFGKPAIIPRGPSAFGCRLGSALVPVFMIREKDDSFHFIMEEPITAKEGIGEEEAIEELTARYLKILEKYISRYPTQWYVFREFWTDGRESLRPNTVV